MPSRYSSDHSKSDAELLARNLGLDYRTITIEPAFQAFQQMLAPSFGERQPGLTFENLQSRCRGQVLMALSNEFGWMVLTTGNKSEMAVGYFTIYGDLVGGYAADQGRAQDLRFDIARHVNRVAGRELIPAAVPHQAAVGRAATRPARRPVTAALRGARPDPRALRRARPGPPPDHRGRTTPSSCAASRGSSTSPSTSATNARPPACVRPSRLRPRPPAADHERIPRLIGVREGRHPAPRGRVRDRAGDLVSMARLAEQVGFDAGSATISCTSSRSARSVGGGPRSPHWRHRRSGSSSGRSWPRPASTPRRCSPRWRRPSTPSRGPADPRAGSRLEPARIHRLRVSVRQSGRPLRRGVHDHPHAVARGRDRLPRVVL